MEDNEASWWRSTQLLALAVLIVGSGVGIGAVIFAPAADIVGTVGTAKTLMVTTLLIPAIVLFLIFWSAARQRRIDRQHGFFEE